MFNYGLGKILTQIRCTQYLHALHDTIPELLFHDTNTPIRIAKVRLNNIPFLANKGFFRGFFPPITLFDFRLMLKYDHSQP